MLFCVLTYFHDAVQSSLVRQNAVLHKALVTPSLSVRHALALRMADDEVLVRVMSVCVSPSRSLLLASASCPPPPSRKHRTPTEWVNKLL